HDNFRAALDGSLEQDAFHVGESQSAAPSQAGLRLCAALAMFWALRGYLAEGTRRCERALAKGASASSVLRARVLNGIGFLALWQNDSETMQRASSEGLLLSREADDVETAALSLAILSAALSELGDLETARLLAEESLGLARTLGLQWLTGLALHTL